MKKLYLTKYAQSPFGKLGDYPIGKMISEAGASDLDGVDRNAVDHVSIAGLLTPLLNDQVLLAGESVTLAKPLVSHLMHRRSAVDLRFDLWN